MHKYTNELKAQLNKTIEENFSRISKITDDMKVSHDGISRMVMLDRYSQKDIKLKTLIEGDLVIAKIKADPKFPTLGIGYVKEITPKYITIDVEDEYLAQIDPALNPEGSTVKIVREDISKPLEIYYEQIALRVSRKLGEEESTEVQEKFFNEMKSLNVVPAGRVLYGAGSGSNATFFNCFVMPMPKDSREGISEHRKEIMEIMARGGGVGTNGSTLRPRDSIAASIQGKSSGAVTWLNDFASLTDLVQQGGSRRGAQMIMMQDWHPDIIEFIISKIQKPAILKYISDNFEHPKIKEVASNKLSFMPFTSLEMEMRKEALKSATNQDLINQIHEEINNGGKYRVTQPEFLSGANISVGITKEFMEAVKADKEYTFRFPDLANMTSGQKEFYDKEWHTIGDVRIWKEIGYPVKEYSSIRAKELWDLINFCATYSAEPGVFFIDRANEMTNASSYFQKVVCTNPCGEQPLAPYSVCNLAALNLANMVDKNTGEVFWDKMKDTVRTMVRMQDNIIDKTPYFLDANERQAKGERRLGMGVMGLHDLLIWKNERYGSPKSIKTIDEVFKTIATTAYIESAKIAEEKGTFTFMTSVDSLLNTGYISKMPNEVKDAIKKHNGLRNSHLLTIAPTGSTGTMVGVSTGLEPYFAFKYFRSGRLGKFMEVEQGIVQEYRKIKGLSQTDELPEIFVSAMELSPEEHADVQTTIQRWIDSSISKTVNAPKGYTVKQVEKIYQRLYDNGAKGGTVYVDGSRDAQVLSLSNDSEIEDTSLIPLSKTGELEITAIKERQADVPNNKQDKEIGVKVGDICPICKEGVVEDIGGCNSCTNCFAQLKCGL